MTIPRVKPSGWISREVLTSAQMNTLDSQVSTRALDGGEGGTYAPTAILQVNGEGLGVGARFDSAGFSPRFGLSMWRRAGAALPTSGDGRGGDWYAAAGRWFVAGNTDAIAFSDNDGLTWTALTGAASTVALADCAVDSGSPSLVAVGNSATAYRSTNITAATPSVSTVTLPGTPTSLFSIRYASGVLCAVGQKSGPAPYFATSSNGGATFTERTAPAGFAGKAVGQLAGAGAIFVAAADSAHTKLAFSSDAGVTWAESTTALSSDTYNLTYNAALGKFLAVGRLTSGRVYESTDGNTWTLLATSPLSSIFNGGIGGGERHGLCSYGRAYAIIGERVNSGITAVAMSYGGTAWSLVGYLDSSSGNQAMFSDANGKHVLAFTDGAIAHSALRRDV